MPKPCEAVQGLPCHGVDGGGIGPAYWDGRPEKIKPAQDKRECEWAERCRSWWRNKTREGRG